MSFNRLNYDTCQYQQVLAESVGPGHYSLNTPPVSCKPCFPTDPSVRLQRSGGSIDTSRPLIDIDSELLNITRPRSKCPSRKWIPRCPHFDATGYPCGQGVTNTCRACASAAASAGGGGGGGGGDGGALRPGEKCPDQFSGNLTHWSDCNLSREDTRMSNPPCNLRGTGINRWEWLCMNPQDRIEMPFDHNISNRIVVKDNHRPCIPKPLSTAVTPTDSGATADCRFTSATCSVPTNPPSVRWQQCSVHQQY